MGGLVLCVVQLCVELLINKPPLSPSMLCVCVCVWSAFCLLDAGYLYAILRLCPYSLLPSLAISAVVWNDHRYGGALGDWSA